MKKKVLQKMLVFVMIILCVLNVESLCASGDYIQDSYGEPNLDEGYGENVRTMGISVINFMIWIGYAVSLGMLLYIGIKYVMASADERASLKGMLVKLFVGACIIFMSSAIVDFALGLFHTLA